jgi:hypothetical protein
MSDPERYLRQYVSSTRMTRRHDKARTIAAPRAALLFAIFFLIACGLGYPVLNRFDPRQTPGLSDVRTYAAMATGAATPDAGHVRFRVLVPWLAKPFYLLARGRLASWDPVMFGLLVADSIFVAGTALLMVDSGIVLGTTLTGAGGELPASAFGLVGALLYLVNFAVPNLRLVGLVDAGEGFFLLAVLWSLAEGALWFLPAIAVLGALTKESFVPFSMVMTASWWLANWSGRSRGRDLLRRDAAWIFASWVLSLMATIGLQWWLTGGFVSPLAFGFTLHQGGGNGGYLGHFAASLNDRNLWYIFLWLLPSAIPSLKRFPRAWLIPVGAACATAFVLDGYFGGAPGTVGRALFSIAGPMLSLSSALLLLQVVGAAV